MKNQTSAFDLYKIVEELQGIVGAKINKVYQSKKDFVLDVFKTGKGRIELRIVVPDFIFITKYKQDYPKEPPKFCMFLRKYLINAVIKEIRQVGFERILELVLETKEKKFIMIIELFSKGNIILCDENYKIINLLQPQSWQARTLRGGTKYKYPPEQINPTSISFEEFEEIIKKTEFDSIVKTLAVDFSLSGIYAEEVCARAKVEKDSKPSPDKKIFKEMQNLFKEKINANVSNQILPFEMISQEKGKSFKSFNEAIDETISKNLLEVKIDTRGIELDKILEEQKKKIKDLEKDIEINQRKGEIIFEKYQELKELLDSINKDRKEMPWDELKAKYKGNKLLKQINEKEGLVIVDL